MTKIIIATFNCENLFMRYRFNAKVSEEKQQEALQNGFILDKKLFERVVPVARELTAKAILATGADIIALQEVENLDTLKSFQKTFLKDYRFALLIDGNDPRLIDVALLSKIPFDTIVTHQYKTKPNSKRKVFSRDCLEVNFIVDKKPLTLFINHLKSMLDMKAKTSEESRRNTAPKRRQQCDAILEIINERFGKNPEKENWIVLGDMNDYNDSQSSLKKLIESPLLENVVEKNLAAGENWTHYWDTSAIPESEKYKQIDYILPSKKLAGKISGKPVIIRSGLTTDAVLCKDKRFAGVTAKISASDHCPVAVTFNF